MYLLICLILGLALRIFKKSNNEIKLNSKTLFYITLIINIGYRMTSQLINLELLQLPIQIISLILIVVFLYNNKQHLEVITVGIGYILNLIVMIVNGGKMPVLTEVTVLDYRHVQVTESTNLKFLADIIYLPYPLSVGMVVSSIGDLIIGIGVIFLIRRL